MSIENLISQMVPLYNEYRDQKKNITGTDALEIMWEIGDILKTYIDRHNLAPHKLFWTVYGNAEGTTNIEQKSYITREFQNRCHRIRRIFNNKEQIRHDLPNLKSFTTFREAMPFFDNQKYILVGSEREKLLSLLNSNLQPKRIIERIRKLQSQRIGIRNPRTQRLHEVEEEKQIFISFYNFIHKILQHDNYCQCIKELKGVDLDLVRAISKNLSALTQEGLKFHDLTIPKDLPNPWKEFCDAINRLITQTDPKTRRRFRRLIPVERMARLSDMLYGLLSEEDFTNFKRK